jgi:hypothetical protein
MMASPKKSSSWQNIRRTLASKSQRELLNLIRDLYNLRPEVQDFINARFVVSAANLKPYQKTIQESLYPDVTHGGDIDLERGRKAINDDQKATHEPIGTLDLMTYYVECGTQFATEYHYGDEAFYEDLDEMFTRVVKLLQQSEQELVDKFLPRLRTIVREAEDIGWGYDDAISATLEDAFPE